MEISLPTRHRAFKKDTCGLSLLTFLNQTICLLSVIRKGLLECTILVLVGTLYKIKFDAPRLVFDPLGGFTIKVTTATTFPL